MADSILGATILGIIVTNMGAVILWVRAEIKKIEQNKTVECVVAKLNQSNSQGDSIASVGKMIASDVIKTAAKDPTLAPFVDKLTLIHANMVNVWNDPDGSDAQMADLEKAANNIYGIVKDALPAQTPAVPKV